MSNLETCFPLSRKPSLGCKPRLGRWGIILSLVALVVAPALAQAHDSVKPGTGERFFPFSVWYSGGKARAPMLEPIDATSRERWKRDLQQIKALGFNTVRTWVEWTANEPRPNQYDFSNLDLLADLAEEVGLKLLVQVYTDSAPDWVGEQWQDARFVTQSGAAVTPQSAPGYCFDHPQVQAKILTFYQEVAKVAARHKNFWGWDLWSEPHIINWAIIDYVPNATFCYCPSSQRRFRDWLKRRYGSIEALNRAWYRTFTRWEQVEPPRFGTILSYTDFIDWRLFTQEKLAEDLRMKRDAVRSIDPTKVTTSHAAVPGLYTSPLWGVGAPDDWMMKDSVDYWGTSIYPKHSFPDRHWSPLTLASLMDFIRSSGRTNAGFYVGELQAGMGIRGTVVGNPVTADDQRQWVLGMLSRGAKAINVYAYYPMNSGYEAGGYGLINLDGTLTPRSQAMGKLAQVVDRNQELFLSGRPAKADVALIYNPLSFLVGGEQHLSKESVVRESLQGIYQAFWKQNVATDFVHLREIGGGALQDYKVAFLPYPLMLTQAAAEGLKAFVADGGTLVAEARCGWNDDRGFSQDIIPGFGLNEVFGVREGRLKMEESVSLWVARTHPVLGSLKPGDQLSGVGIIEQLLPGDTAQVLATTPNGDALMTVNQYQKGTAIAVGSFLGMANRQEQNANDETFFLSVARAAGVKPVLALEGVPAGAFVEVRRLETRGGDLLFLFNHADTGLEVRLPVEDLSDLETGRAQAPGAVALEPGAVRVFRVPAGG